MSQSHHFADRIINVAVTGPLVRLELGALKPQIEQGQKPQLVSTGTVVMPLDGFLASFGALETVVKKMVADGLVKAKGPANPATDDGITTPLQ